MKKRIFLTMLLLGGLIMMGLTGCGENKNSREWIENKVSEVSRVYPTENLIDLFKQFPEGFEIEQVYFKEKSNGLDDFITEIKLKGDAISHTITGTLAKIPAKDDAPKSDEVVVSVQYVDNKFIFSDEETAKKIWKFDGFLFQKLALNKTELSKLRLKEKSYDSITNGFSILYFMENKINNNYFHKNDSEESTLEIGSSLQNEGYYYYSILVDYKDGYYFRETVSNAGVYNGQ
ncbi:hypothetical protein QM458_06445 [Streptococcus infantis]|uniref:hypothetical protein n=1 Tax=Streptococcus infantis TaxID=68892 RepID=UPI0039C12248